MDNGEVLLLLLQAVVLGGLVLGWLLVTRRADRARAGRAQLIDELERRLELEIGEREYDELRGLLDGVPVEVHYANVSRDDPFLRITVGRDGQVPSPLILVREGDRLDDTTLPRRDQLTGDPDFDRGITLLGTRANIANTMTPEVRAAALEVIGELGCHVRDGRAHDKVKEVGADVETLVERVTRLAGLVRTMSVPEPTVRRLVSLLERETCAAMVGRIAELLFTRHPEGGRTARAAETLANHPSGRARLFAGICLHDGGPALLARIADDQIDEQVFCQALEWAADQLKPGVVQAAALEGLEVDDDPLRLLACRLLAEQGPAEAVGALHRLADRRGAARPVREAARDAMRAVRSRFDIVGAEGGLQLTDEDRRQGGLELADGPGDGGLELAD